MAKFDPPTNFDFNKPAEWPDWRKRFSRYRTATKLDKESAEIQISTLIYAIGKEAENIFDSFTWENEDDKKDFDKVLKMYDNYFVPRKNVIHERARFHQRGQNQGETIEMFVRSLYEIADACDFKCKEEQIRDRLVIGILDRELSEKLQLQCDLTLNMAIQMARQSELVKSQVKIQGQASSVSVQLEEVHNTRTYGQGRASASASNVTNFPACSNCNRKHSRTARCPAMGKRCNFCHKYNHFAVCCRTRRAQEVVYTRENTTEIAQADSTDEIVGLHSQEQRGCGNMPNKYCDNCNRWYLGSVTICHDDRDAWYVTLNVCDKDLSFKLYSGADVSVISESIYNTLPHRPLLQPVRRGMDSPGGMMDCLGKFSTTVTYNGGQYQFNIYVIKGQRHTCLLGRQVSKTLGLLQRVEEVSNNVSDNVFGTTGLLKCEPAKITLKEGAVPYCVTTARRVPFPLLHKVEDELNHMESSGIIVKVTEPTEWCSPMVPVVKANGQVRICVDLKKLNTAVKREHLMLPNLDDIAPNLVGSTVYSKLDASSGFHQIPLHPDSSRLTFIHL